VSGGDILHRARRGQHDPVAEIYRFSHLLPGLGLGQRVCDDDDVPAAHFGLEQKRFAVGR